MTALFGNILAEAIVVWLVSSTAATLLSELVLTTTPKFGAETKAVSFREGATVPACSEAIAVADVICGKSVANVL